LIFFVELTTYNISYTFLGISDDNEDIPIDDVDDDDDDDELPKVDNVES